jgi:hypothetical protein
MNIVMDITYFCVTVNTPPFSSDTEYEIGNYINEDIAKKVWSFLYQVNDYKNMEIKIKKYLSQCIICNAGIRLKDTPKGCITMICEKLNRKEYLRLINIDIPKNDDIGEIRYLNLDI